MTAQPLKRDDPESRVHLQYAVSRAVAGAETVGQATSAFLAEVGAAMGWDFGSVWLVDHDANDLRPIAAWPDRPSAFREATLARRMAKGVGLPGRVWETGELQWITDIRLAGDLERAEAAAREGLRAALVFPTCAGKKTVGVVEFFSRSPREPDESLRETLVALSLQLGEFIERKRAVEAERAGQLLTAATLQIALDSVVIIDAGGRILEFNQAAERTFGYRRADVLGKPMSELIVPPHLRAAHRAGMERYLTTGETRVMGKRIEITAMRSDGSEFPVELAIQRAPVDGLPVFTAYIRDLTERRRLESSQRLLLDASAILISSLDFEETLANLSRVIVPGFADWYAADVANPDGTVRRITVAHRDPAKVEFARQLAERYPPKPDDPRGIHEVIRTGKSQLVHEISDEMLAQGVVDEEHLRLIRGLGLLSYMVVPMRARSGVVGALTLVTAESNRRYDASDLAVVEELARQGAQAIENSRLFAAVEEQRELLEQQAVELEAQSAELEETAAELEATVDELRASNEQLQRRTDEAESAQREADDANKAKSDFLASMSHELRTPLNAIIGYAQLLEIGIHGALAPKQLEDLGRISRSAQHLLGLINDILNYAKVEAGRVEFEIEPVDVAPLLARVEEMIAPQAKAKSLAYSVRIDCPEARVCADAEKLMQIVVNLLSNAVRYTDPGGRIDVHCHATHDLVVTEVCDTGVGIPPDKLEAIFEPFVQVNHEYAGQHQGTGLGLAISRDLARGMGGSLAVESQVGKGSKFTLTLKRERPTAK